MTKKQFDSLKLGDKVAKKDIHGWTKGSVIKFVFDDNECDLLGIIFMPDDKTFSFCHREDCELLLFNNS